MPSKSAAQARLMAAVAHNPAFAKKVGISQSVGRDFNQADKGRKFGSGGNVESEKQKELRHASTLRKLAQEEQAEANAMKKGGLAMAKMNPFKGKESKSEESKEKKMFGSGAAYKKAEKKFEGERFAKGGSVDGIAQRGKTKGTVITMKKGGSCR